ncbi:MAG: hypothetical protein ACLFWD_09690 [Anaerolineales bacterium]
MQAEKFSRLGFHYPKDEYQHTVQDCRLWLDQLSGLPAGWVLVEGTTERAIPEPFLKKIMSAGLKPIVHMPGQIGAVRAEAINPLLYSYAHWGVEYVVVYDRPNLKSSWHGNSWTSSNLVERFVDAMLPILQASHAAGLKPILPPLEPGGDYWDTAFLNSTLKALARRGQQSLLDALTLTAYTWTKGKDIDWGKGGPEAWPQARPYFTPEESQDHQGFHIYEWYRAIAAEALGKERPVLALAGGADIKNKPHEEINARIAAQLQLAESHQGLLAMCFPALPSSDKRARWIIEEPEKAPKAAAKSAAPENATVKRLAHYLLLPPEEEHAVPVWRKATAFALTHQPVVGFSVKEACLAKRVTIAADTNLIPAEVDTKLEAAGCQVERLSLLPTRKSCCQPTH